MPVPRLGLTGGIACGKSAILQIFADFGWITLSADALCHQIYRERRSDFATRFQQRWGGSSYLDADGELDRAAVGDAAVHACRERQLTGYPLTSSGSTGPLPLTKIGFAGHHAFQ